MPRPPTAHRHPHSNARQFDLFGDRLIPPRKDRPVSFDLPKIESAKDAVNAISVTIHAVSVGDLTPAEASDLTRLLDAYVKAFEATELAERVERLEKASTGGRQ